MVGKGSGGAGLSEGRLPQILHIVADDLGYNDLCDASPHLPNPTPLRTPQPPAALTGLPWGQGLHERREDAHAAHQPSRQERHTAHGLPHVQSLLGAAPPTPIG